MKYMRHLIMLSAIALMVGCSQSEHRDIATVGDTKSPSLQMRLVADSLSAECEQMTLPLEREDRSQPEVIFVQKAVVLDETDVVKARYWVRGDIVGLDILLRDKGSNQLAEITRHNIGRRAAVLIDGKLRAAPTIKGTVTLGEFDVSSNWSIEEARRLAERLGQTVKQGR
jgi:preprotein translocase subunit SecD